MDRCRRLHLDHGEGGRGSETMKKSVQWNENTLKTVRA